MLLVVVDIEDSDFTVVSDDTVVPDDPVLPLDDVASDEESVAGFFSEGKDKINRIMYVGDNQEA